MAETGKMLEDTFTSEWDLSAKQYRAVLIGSGDHKVICASAAGDAVFGLVQNKPTSGKAARVAFAGLAKGIAGGTVTRGNYLRANATAYLVAGNSAQVLGTAMESANSGSVFQVLVHPQYTTTSG